MGYILYGILGGFLGWFVQIILFIIIFYKLSSLKKELREIKSGVPHKDLPATTPANIGVLPTDYLNVQSAISINQNVASTPVTQPMVEEGPSWFKENILLKIGVLMIIIGFGWFVSYAFTHNWIGPVGRITLGVIAGTILTFVGTMRLAKNLVQGNALTILGSALIVLTLISGTYIYGFFPPVVLLALVFIVSLYVTISAMAYSSEKLAIYGILVSLFAPQFSSVSMLPVVLYLYLLIVSATTIWISVAKDWRNVSAIGITGVLLYTLKTVFGGVGQEEYKFIVLIIAYAIAVLYLLVNIWGLIKNKLQADQIDVYLSFFNTAIILGFTNSIVPTVYKSLIVSAWMLVYALSGFYVFQKTKKEKLFYIHALISVFLLAVATSIELSGPTLVIAFAIEASIIAVASFVVTNRVEVSEKMSLLLAVPFIMSLQSLVSSNWSKGVLHSDFTVLFVMAVILALLGVFYKMNKREDSVGVKVYEVAFIASTFYVYALIWLSLHFLMDSDSAVFVSLFIYTVVGLGTHFAGIFKHNESMRKYGMFILILVVMRLVLVDVWKMELVLRVVTFIVLGVMFMSSAFISKSQKNNNLIKT